MHRTPNNAQNTQHKLGVAFSYLERNNMLKENTVRDRRCWVTVDQLWLCCHPIGKFFGSHCSINLNIRKQILETWFTRLESRFIWVLNFQKSACFSQWTRFTFSFQKRKVSREFCHSFIESWHRGYCHKNQSFRCPRGLLVLNFSHPRANRRSLWRPGIH